jgi:hypothetical protein
MSAVGAVSTSDGSAYAGAVTADSSRGFPPGPRGNPVPLDPVETALELYDKFGHVSVPVWQDQTFLAADVGLGQFVYGDATTPTTFANGAGIAADHSGFTASNDPSPIGNVAFMQGGGYFSQSVSGFQANQEYTISFDAAQRAGNDQDFEVLVDGKVVGYFSPDDAYGVSSTATFTVATSGAHTITFQGLDTAGGDNTAFVTDINISRADRDTILAGGTSLNDGSFETDAITDGQFQYGPNTTSAWEFAGGTGISGANSGFTGGTPNGTNGNDVAFIQGGTGSKISQLVGDFQANTAYVIAFTAAQRLNNNQDFKVTVDGNVVGTFRPQDSNYRLEYTAAFTPGAGAHVIAFEGIDSAGGDNTAFIDAVHVMAVGSPAAPPGALSSIDRAGGTSLGDGSFENVSVPTGTFQYYPTGSAWAFGGGGTGISSVGSGFTAASPQQTPTGTQVAFLQGGGVVSQAVSGFDGASSYVLSFNAAQRSGNHQDVQVLVDGVEIARVTPDSDRYQRYAFALPQNLAAGTHTIAFVGLDSAGGDNTAFIDDVALGVDPNDQQIQQLQYAGLQNWANQVLNGPGLGASSNEILDSRGNVEAYDQVTSSNGALVESIYDGNGNLVVDSLGSAPQAGQPTAYADPFAYASNYSSALGDQLVPFNASPNATATGSTQRQTLDTGSYYGEDFWDDEFFSFVDTGSTPPNPGPPVDQNGNPLQTNDQGYGWDPFTNDFDIPPGYSLNLQTGAFQNLTPLPPNIQTIGSVTTYYDSAMATMFANDYALATYMEYGMGIAIGAGGALYVGAEIAGTGAVAGLREVTRQSTTVLAKEATHIFGPKSLAKHNLSGLLQSFNGNANAATQALRDAAEQYFQNNPSALVEGAQFVDRYGTTLVVNVNGYSVGLNGQVVNGVFRIGTAFVK